MQISRRAFALALPAGAMLLAKDNGGESLKQVTPSFVCFINKKYFKKAQEPVTVDGKTYFACCANCVDQLKNDPRSRVDKDPVSGKEIDKATAAVGTDKEGNVYFFENPANLKKYRTTAKM